MKFRILIKGNEAQARAAAMAHGVEIISMEEALRVSPTNTFAIAESDYETLGKWFSEEPQTIPGYGHVAGTLLHYALKS